MTTERIDWDSYFLNIAKAVSARADCRRAQYGSVIVKDKRVVSTGYNGSPAGDQRSCLQGDCPRGLLTHEELAHNNPDYSNCISLHSEQNAIAYASHHDTLGATIYIWGGRPPCDSCAKLIAAAGITRIVIQE